MRVLILVLAGLALPASALAAEGVLCSPQQCSDPVFLAKLWEQGKDCMCERQRTNKPDFIIDLRKLRGMGYRG